VGARGAIALAVSVTMAGCAGSAAPPAPPASVHLTVTAPRDQVTTLAPSVIVSGTVSPARATVLVAGRPVPVVHGGFGTRVSLGAGENLIDVLAGAPHAAGAASTVRVLRQLPVAVPDLTGVNPDVGTSRLAARGLASTQVDVGGFLQKLLPTSSRVCRTVPAAGRLVPPGTRVRVEVAKLC
jgi:glucodextranase-like protein